MSGLPNYMSYPTAMTFLRYKIRYVLLKSSNINAAKRVYHSRCLKLQKLGVKILQNFFRNFLPFTHYACFIECLHALIFRNAPCFLYVISINMNSNWSGKVEFSLDLKRDITSNCSKNQHLTF